MADLKIKIDLTPMQRRFSRNIPEAQRFLDYTILKKSEPYTPKLTGAMIESSIENTNVGGGAVVWRTPYARRQYYTPRPVGTPRGALRGYRWVDRMLVDHGKEILEETKRIVVKK